MDADGLPARLERDDAAPTVAAFPDGSVDTFYRVAAGGERVHTRGAFAHADAALAHLRERPGLTAAVVHGESRAAAATSDWLVADENVDVDAVRHTGGGDRFDAGLAHALARGWGWADALRLGNARASCCVATGESGTPVELAGFLREEG